MSVICVLQAYRLEPLVNEAYASIRPVKIDSSGSKPSKTALDHAEGPKSDQVLAAPSDQEGGWWMSSLMNIFPGSILKPDPDKVGIWARLKYRLWICIVLILLQHSHVHVNYLDKIKLRFHILYHCGLKTFCHALNIIIMCTILIVKLNQPVNFCAFHL